MDFREVIAKKIGFPLQDRIKGTNIINTIEVLSKSQYWENNRIEQYQLQKLQTLVKFAYENVPYYTKLFNHINLKPSDIKSVSDLQLIPVLTKEIVRKENKNLIANGFNLQKVKKGKTGGTTGSPVVIYKDIQNRSFTWASYYRWYTWMGISYGERSASLWGAGNVLRSSMKERIIDIGIKFLHNKLKINSFNLNEDNLLSTYEKLRKFKPKILKGYVSALIQLAQFMESNNLHDLHPSVISTTTETLLPYHREYLSRIFNAPIFDQYGCGEVSAISYECSQHNGLHVNQEHVILEILDEEGNPLIEQKGRVIATDLDNYVMPFIRYENGDISSVSHRKCKCGVNQPLMGPIEGRAATSIVLANGSKVHGVFFTDILFELNITTDEINRFQVFQEEGGKIQFRVETKKILSESLKDKLIKALKRFFSEVDIAEYNQLEHEPNGKFLYMKKSEKFQE